MLISVLIMVVAVALAFLGARLLGGGPEGLAVAVLVVTAALALVVIRAASAGRRTAARAGYGSIGEYLRAVPRSDEERQHAVDLALKGLVWCLAGLLVPPLILVGIFPLYYGTRKIVYASMGLGLVDDADPPGA